MSAIAVRAGHRTLARRGFELLVLDGRRWPHDLDGSIGRLGSGKEGHKYRLRPLPGRQRSRLEETSITDYTATSRCLSKEFSKSLIAFFPNDPFRILSRRDIEVETQQF